MDTSHLEALMLRLSNERARLANASKASEIRMRQVWIAQIEDEIEGERKFLGYKAEEALSDDQLAAELAGLLDDGEA